MQQPSFLPISQKEARARGWDEIDFLLLSGDAYVDHPSFGPAIIGRVLENEGFRVGILPQPDINDPKALTQFGKPKYAVLLAGGNVDSMVAHYTVSKRRRTFDEYTPGGKAGKRPDRVVDVYTALAKKVYPDLPVITGGLEASLRRFAHYDYWSDAVRPSILETSGADIVLFGMGERSIRELGRRLAAGETIEEITDLPGSAYLTTFDKLPVKYAECASFKKVAQDKTAYAKACRIQLDNQDSVAVMPLVQKQSEKYLVQNVPSRALGRTELDTVYALPFTRTWHPSYNDAGGIPALEEVEFSVIHNRGCFGGCNFCAIALHQGLRVTSRSADSVVAEGELITKQPGFKGYIHDVGGPTANFRKPSCGKQMTEGVCKGGKRCLAPAPCQKLIIDHSEYLGILRRLRKLPGVKKVFVRSGIRYDYLVHDKDDAFFKELVQHHISGQLKVAPEHCSPGVLKAMGKPPIEVYNRFAKKFYQLTAQAGKKQYLVPYLISSHPGSTMTDAVLLAEYLYDNRVKPEQVQDFYPTPGTVSTCMYYTGLDPYTLKSVYVARDPEEKAMQRALLQYYDPKNTALVRRALAACGKEHLAVKLLAGRAGAQTKKAPQHETKTAGSGKGNSATSFNRREAGKNKPGVNRTRIKNTQGGKRGKYGAGQKAKQNSR